MTRKRALDLFLTVLGAIAWVPVVLMAASLVLITSGRPVFYRSMRRVSKDDLMKVVKFRTMVKNADKIANRETLPVNHVRFLNIPPDSPLYTRAGRILERGGITELPQFVHVLSGRMSIVGNRPLPDNVLDCLREEYPYADERFLTRAGLTGPAQLVGREQLTDDERLRLESAYCRACVHSYSMWLDLSILRLHRADRARRQEVARLPGHRWTSSTVAPRRPGSSSRTARCPSRRPAASSSSRSSSQARTNSPSHCIIWPVRPENPGSMMCSRKPCSRISA